MQPVEVGAPFLVSADHLRVDDSGRLDPVRLLDDEGVPVGPVGPVDRVEPHPPCPGVYLQPVAVVLDLMHPAVAAGRPFRHGRSAGLDESPAARSYPAAGRYANATT